MNCEIMLNMVLDDASKDRHSCENSKSCTREGPQDVKHEDIQTAEMFNTSLPREDSIIAINSLYRASTALQLAHGIDSKIQAQDASR